MEERMKKEERLSFGTDTMVPIRDGKSSILTKPRRNQPRDLTQTSACIVTDHSTSDQDFQ